MSLLKTQDCIFFKDAVTQAVSVSFCFQIISVHSFHKVVTCSNYIRKNFLIPFRNKISWDILCLFLIFKTAFPTKLKLLHLFLLVSVSNSVQSIPFIRLWLAVTICSKTFRYCLGTKVLKIFRAFMYTKDCISYKIAASTVVPFSFCFQFILVDVFHTAVTCSHYMLKNF